MSALTPRLIQTVLAQFALHHRGIHGAAHWARVLHNGRLLAEASGARVEVVELFALFHDCRRMSDGADWGHGERGAEFARELRGELFQLDDSGFDLLYEACRDHSDGHVEGDVTLRTCWDADRLDLYRVGIRPRARFLCTELAREQRVIDAAIERSTEWRLPELAAEWIALLDDEPPAPERRRERRSRVR